MITKYGEYCNEIDLLKINFREKLEEELSKYLRKEVVTDFKYVVLGKQIKETNIFLLDNNYGVRVKSVNRKGDKIIATINTIYKSKDKFRNAGYPATYSADSNTSISDFIDKYIKKLLITNEIRKRNNEKRVFQRDTKKYNI